MRSTHTLSTRLVAVFLSLAPLCVVTLRGWSGAILIIGALVAFTVWLRRGDFSALADRRDQVLITALCLPFFTVALSSTLRANLHMAEFDGPLRFVLAIAIFLFMTQARVNALAMLQYTLPLGLLTTIFLQFAVAQPHPWGADRMATYFADPLVFGYTSLAMGLMCLFSIHALKKDPHWLVALKLAGATVGIYLSIRSGSRTGWFVAPLVCVIWLYQQRLLGARVKVVAVSGLVALSAVFLVLLNDTVWLRITQAVHEVLAYNWQGFAPETSVGLRITFIRIAADLFQASPIFGYGDTALNTVALPPGVSSYASEEAIRMALHAGFHNEIVSSTVWYGVGGGIAAASVMLLPLSLFALHLRSFDRVKRANATTGMIFVLTIFVSSMTTEVFDLKYTVSFYATMVALLCGSVLFAEQGLVEGDT